MAVDDETDVVPSEDTRLKLALRWGMAALGVGAGLSLASSNVFPDLEATWQKVAYAVFVCAVGCLGSQLAAEFLYWRARRRTSHARSYSASDRDGQGQRRRADLYTVLGRVCLVLNSLLLGAWILLALPLGGQVFRCSSRKPDLLRMNRAIVHIGASTGSPQDVTLAFTDANGIPVDRVVVLGEWCGSPPTVVRSETDALGLAVLSVPATQTTGGGRLELKLTSIARDGFELGGGVGSLIVVTPTLPSGGVPGVSQSAGAAAGHAGAGPSTP